MNVSKCLESNYKLYQTHHFSNQMILVVSDPLLQEQYIAEYLEQSGYKVCHGKGFQEGLQLALTEKPSLILLDWGEASEISFAFIMAIKKNPLTQNIQVIFVANTFKDQTINEYLNIGADDYIVKPYPNYVFDVRVQCALRRSLKSTSSIDLVSQQYLEVHRLKLDSSQRVVLLDTQDGVETIDVCPIGFKLLYFLAKNPDRAFTRTDLIAHIWGTLDAIDGRSIDVYIRRLRQALASKKIEQVIRTVRGVGYSFNSSIISYRFT